MAKLTALHSYGGVGGCSKSMKRIKPPNIMGRETVREMTSSRGLTGEHDWQPIFEAVSLHSEINRTENMVAKARQHQGQ